MGATLPRAPATEQVADRRSSLRSFRKNVDCGLNGRPLGVQWGHKEAGIAQGDLGSFRTLKKDEAAGFGGFLSPKRLRLSFVAF